MSVNIIYGSVKSGKTAKCIEIMKKIGKDVCYIVPEPFSYGAEIEIAKLFGAVSSYLTDVTSFKRLYHKVINEFGIGGCERLTKSGKQILLGLVCRRVSSKLTVLKRASAYSGFTEILSDITKEFATYSVSPDDIKNAAEKAEDSALKNKLGDIYTIYSEFVRLLGDKYITGDDELTLLAKIISANKDYFAESTFIFDGFASFTPQEMQVIKNLHDCGSGIYIAFSALPTGGNDEDSLYSDQIADIKALKEFTEIKYFKTGKIYAPEDLAHLAECFEKNSKTKQKSENIFITEYNTVHDEIRSVAEQIKRLVKSGKRYRDIAVSARDSERYLNIISEIFGQYEIPCFISKKINASTQPAADAVFGAMNTAVENFSYKTLFSYLKSGFAADVRDEVDLLENYCLAVGIKGNGYKKEWKYTPKIANDFDSEEEFLAEINRIRKKLIEPLIRLSDGLNKNKTVKEKCTVLFEFMTDINLFENTKAGVERFRESAPEISAYYGQIWNILIDSLDEAASLAGNEEVSAAEFVQMIKSAVSSHEIGSIPTSLDSVTICGANDAADADILFVVGTNDGVYPQIMSDEGILNDDDRKNLLKIGVKLAPDTVKRAFSEDFLILNLLMRAKSKLYISYPISDISGNSYRPSRIIHRICGCFDNLRVQSRIVPAAPTKENILAKRPAFSYMAAVLRNEADGFAADEIWHETAGFFKETDPKKYELFLSAMNYKPSANGIDSPILDEFFKDGTLNVSVSRLESYKKCPFAHFLKHMLYINKRKTAGLENTDTGSLMHEIMQELSNEITVNGLSWRTADEAFIKRTAERLIDKKITETEALFDIKSRKRTHLLLRLKKMLILSVSYVANHLRAGKFEPIGYEINIGGGKYIPLTIKADGKTVKLKGIIDRADMYTDENGGRYLRIVDYKSGSRDFDIGKMMCGLELQLAVYLDRMCTLEDAKPAGVLYFRFKDPIIEADETDETAPLLADEFKMTGIVVNDLKIINAMDENIVKKSNVIPVNLLKDGSLGKTSHAVSFNQFMGIRKETNKLIKSISREILHGKTDIAPIKYGRETGCDFCDFKDICHFEKKLGCKFNYIAAVDKNELMEQLEREGKENA